jgi:Tfp pilus assembly protein PilN
MTVVMNKPADVPVAAEPDAPVRFVRIRANLLPDEIVAARRLSRLKRRMGVGIGALAVLLAAGYGYSWWQTSKAEDSLATAQFQTNDLTSKLTSFEPLIAAQTQTTQIRSELSTAMADDLQWSKLIASVSKAAGGQLVVTSFGGTISASVEASPLNNSGQQIVGTLTISGNTPDYRSVASFVDTLSTLKGLAVVDPATVSGGAHGEYTFSVTVSLTTDALGGRFTVAPVAPAPVAPGTTTGGN